MKLKIPAPSAFRRHWLLKPGIVFLNHGSFGACPEPILELQAGLRRQMEEEPVQFLWRRYEERLDPSRNIVADFVGARSQDVVFVTNTTTGINTVARSLNLRRGDEILTTSHDYNACHNILVEAVRRAGARLTVARIPFPLRSADAIIDSVLDAVTPKTRLAMLDHVTSESAVILPLGRLIRELESRGVDTLVDGAHAPGMVPINLTKLRPAYYTGNLHKWACAPKGAAFLWVREDRQEGIQPAVISHGNNTTRPRHTSFQDRFDWAGTGDPTAWMCAGAAIEWMGKLLPGGWPELRKRNHALAAQARRILCDRLGIKAPCPESMLGSMATIPLPPEFPDEPFNGKLDGTQARLYDQHGVEVPFFRRKQPQARWVRVSAHIYNAPAEYEYLADILKEIQS